MDRKWIDCTMATVSFHSPDIALSNLIQTRDTAVTVRVCNASRRVELQLPGRERVLTRFTDTGRFVGRVEEEVGIHEA